MLQDPLTSDKLTLLFKTSSSNPNRIISREGSTLEFKEAFNFGGMAQYFKTMAAFANNNGGYIIFGIGDKPRDLIGLKGKSLEQFENLKVEDFTKNLLDYFSPEIKWEHCTFEFRGGCYGIIYTYPLRRKPCVCKKQYDSQNPKYALKEADIYYRYGGRSEKIRYTELTEIIESVRRDEERQWLDFAKQAAKIGIEDACLLDLKTGNLTGNGGLVIIDEELLSKIAFIKEGEFVETKGKPALRLIGDIQDISTGKIIAQGKTKKVVRAIEVSEIYRSFLEGRKVSDPIEYLKVACSASSAYQPIYHLIAQSNLSMTEIINLIDSVTVRGQTKERIKGRLDGKVIEQPGIPSGTSDGAIKKKDYRVRWLDKTIVEPTDSKELKRCLDAVLLLSNQEIADNQEYIRGKLLSIFNAEYENAPTQLASSIRNAICRADEALNLERCK